MDDMTITKRTDGRSKEARATRAAEAAAAKREAAAVERITKASEGKPVRRASPRTNARSQQVHEPTREPTRSRSARVAVTGRSGETLSRKRTQAGDIFHIPAELIEPGWEMQWAAVSCKGDTEILLDQNLMFAENGWRPVPSNRPGFHGRYMPEGHKGSIVRGGQMLMERPKALCDEARLEDKRAAIQQVRDRDQALLGGKANARGSFNNGLEMRNNLSFAKMSIDPGLNIPTPGEYQLED